MPGRIKSLQAGRGIAALAVAGFHLNGLLPGSTIAQWFAHGNAGVDFFFVLSGFIIFYAHEKDVGQPARIWRYLRNRFVRVYPIYWVFTAAMVLAVLAGVGATPLPRDLGGWVSTVALVRLTDTPTPLNVAWTLFYEIAFYLVFASLILSKRLGWIALGAWALVVLAFHHSTPTNSVVGVWTSRLSFNFFLGMGACWLHSRISVRAGLVLIGAGAVLLIAGGIVVDRGGWWAFGSLVAVGCAALIAGFSGIETTKPLLFGPLVVLGDASYTLYLAHVHLESWTLKGLGAIGALRVLPPDASAPILLAAAVAGSLALYYAIERPLVSALRSCARPPSLVLAE